MRAPLLTLPLILAVLGLTACSPKEGEEQPAKTYSIGERVRLGHLNYMVFERQSLPQIGTGLDARVPQNRFYLIRLSVLNSGGSPVILPTLSLMDDSGATFSESQDGSGVPDFIGALRQIDPAQSAQGNLIFDVPPKHYKLKLSDEDGKEIGFVDIPLSFDSDAPDVTTPLGSDITKK